jgi:hypothetical protein
MNRPTHNPIGSPCKICGFPPIMHRVGHAPQGDPCTICGLPPLCHRVPLPVTRVQVGYVEPFVTGETVYLGIDGEGQGRKYHKYIFLATADTTGQFRRSIENKDGLKTEDCLDFLLDLPHGKAKIFAYSFGYDLTKILTDVDNECLYRLFRPEERQRTGEEAVLGPYPEMWRGYKLNFQGAKFTVQQGRRKTVIWDIFKFFQGRFVAALEDWKVGEKALVENMKHMKDARADFDKLDFEDVKNYCYDECMCMAELAKRLTDAHTAAGLTLKSYYGAGSSAAAMLNVMGIKEKINNGYPKEMRTAVASAFFGGRFENSVIGKVEQTVYVYDISSAYPYQLYFLPCLLHGRWSLTRSRRALDGPRVRSAIVKYELKRHNFRETWGPFPFRSHEGTICFPSASGGGWVCKDEYLAGEKLWPYVGFQEAWIYECDCDCKPFAKIPEYYLERLRIGKEGPGIVIKLGCNSCYGKLAQSVGNAIFNSWLWAALITSGTRSQLLELIGLHRNRASALMTATDGLATLEELDCPKPRETGTDRVVIEQNTGKEKYAPLGGWEKKTFKQGMFFARPGVYFPLNPTKQDIKDVRGRGVGKGVILENWERIIGAWPVSNLHDTISVSNVSRFCGAKSSISRSGGIGGYKYNRANGTGSQPRYGQWITRKVDMSFEPLPKRGGLEKDGRHLTVRKLPWGIESTPYDACTWNEDNAELKAAEAELLEQPDGDVEDYE